MADRTLTFDSSFTVTVDDVSVTSPYTLTKSCVIDASHASGDTSGLYMNGETWASLPDPLVVEDENISLTSLGGRPEPGGPSGLTINYEAPSVPTPDWANCFVKTSAGNKAVEKVWIKQNGQLVTVYEAETPRSFATDTWAQISEACKDGTYKTLYAVGDTKDIELSTGETITVVIIGFDHDDLSDGSGKAPITVAMENLLTTAYPMNSSQTNAGGWGECLMRTSTMATLLSQLPSDLQGVIKQVNKKAVADSQGENITTSADKLWLFALAEIFSATSIENTSTANIAKYADAFNAEGTQYKYYENLIGDNNGGTATNSLLIKKLSNGSGSADDWWLRSPFVGSSKSFWAILFTGYNGGKYASAACGVCFGFCVG